MTVVNAGSAATGGRWVSGGGRVDGAEEVR